MMKIFDTLTSRNFELFASQHYNNPECIEIEEFKEDLTRFKYLKSIPIYIFAQCITKKSFQSCYCVF